MAILAIDPGTESSALIGWDGRSILFHEISPNEVILQKLVDSAELCNGTPRPLAIEMIESQGMAVGRSTFLTVLWIGRFMQAYYPSAVHLIGRQTVKLHMCGSSRAKDSNVRQACIDRIGEPGTRKKPGPTFGIASHEWSALAIAITFTDTHGNGV